ncbi:MAG: hypothetical protein KJO07_04545 [Deltaproteobacteria bacterium]|nr:hypothetical protein [Deltaproteobacteria bacterium]
MRLTTIPLLAVLACGGAPAPQGPGTEPTNTIEQTSKAGPKPGGQSPVPTGLRPASKTARTPTAAGDGRELPPQYDFELIPRCQRSARGSKTRSPIKNFKGVAQSDLINTYGPPSCMYRGRWRYEFRAEPCPSFVDTLELKVSGGSVRDQKSYRRSTGITCSKKPAAASSKG